MHIYFLLSGNADRDSVSFNDAEALAKALMSQDHKATLIAPLHPDISPEQRGLARRLTPSTATVNGEEFKFHLYTGRAMSGVATAFLGGDSISEIEAGGDAAAAFASAARGIAKGDDADLVIAWDALAALGESELPSFFYVTNAESDSPAFTKAVESADHLLVSGNAIANALLARYPELDASKIDNLPAGIDLASWNPMTDPELPARFDPVDLRGKTKCRRNLQEVAGLPLRSDVALLTVGPDEASVESFLKVATQWVRNEVQVVVLTTGDASPELLELTERWPDRIGAILDSTATEVHQALAGADLFFQEASSVSALLPALRYGAIPVVQLTAALSENIVGCDANLITGNAFVYDAKSDEELLGALRSAAASVHLPNFRGLRTRAMKVDYSLARAARLVARLAEKRFSNENVAQL